MSKHTFLAILALLATVAHLAAGFTPAPQYGQSAVLTNNTIFVCGGTRLINSQYVTVTNLYSLDVSQPWTSTNPPWVDLTDTTSSIAVPLSSYYAMWPSADNGSFYVWGGGNNLNRSLLQSGFSQYNIVTRIWSLPSTIANMPQQRRLLSAAWTSSGVAYMWGGQGDASNGQMVFIGGLTMLQLNATYVSRDYAQMNDIPIFDTNSATWKQINATGAIPAVRYLHTAVLGTDDTSIVICCGRNDTYSFSSVAVLDTRNWYWTNPGVVKNAYAPSPRSALSSVIVNGQMIVFFGSANTPYNDISVLDTRMNPFKWIAGFSPPPTPTPSPPSSTPSSTPSSPSPSSSTDIPNGSSSLITPIAITSSVLVVVAAILIFLFIRKPWRKYAQNESSQGLNAASQSSPLSYASNTNQIQMAHPHILLPVHLQVQTTDAGIPLPVQPLQHGYHGQPGQGGYMNHQIQQATPYSPPSNHVTPLQYDYGGQPGYHEHTSHQIQPAVSASPAPVMPPIPSPQYSYNNLHAQDRYTNHPNQQMDPHSLSSNTIMPPIQPLQYGHAKPDQPEYNNHAPRSDLHRHTGDYQAGFGQSALMNEPRNSYYDTPRGL
ncbi:hypothetical protein BC938DRAFT_478563 [Jimgerdemannia flammicorona]|uniref:Galactose oxidase n=1 Tax=Jimgerdemannia flammicorona TaxID=994334 RepID=A0A433QMP7_9FUNG|nr:hypothetical protein BC938DRAFT_478563 [Jimgerdemannia flammicorona]